MQFENSGNIFGAILRAGNIALGLLDQPVSPTGHSGTLLAKTGLG